LSCIHTSYSKSVYVGALWNKRGWNRSRGFRFLIILGNHRTLVHVCNVFFWHWDLPANFQPISSPSVENSISTNQVMIDFKCTKEAESSDRKVNRINFLMKFDLNRKSTCNDFTLTCPSISISKMVLLY